MIYTRIQYQRCFQQKHKSHFASHLSYVPETHFSTVRVSYNVSDEAFRVLSITQDVSGEVELNNCWHIWGMGHSN